MATPITNPQPFPESLITIEGHTYIIDREIALTGNLTLAAGITLIFQGGRFVKSPSSNIVGDITISAPSAPTNFEPDWTNPTKGVTLIAPFSVIFGKGISVIGYWALEQACPLWFEPELKPMKTGGNDIRPDYANSINKAIRMMGKGEVYLPGGDYYITSPIFIPQGITLCGANGHLYDHKSTVISPMGTKDPTTSNNTKNAAPNSSAELLYEHPYLVYVNCLADKQPIVDYCYPWEALRDISFINYPKKNSWRCVFVCYAGLFRNIKWYDFIQAVAYNSDCYTDAKSIVNCNTEILTTFTLPNDLPEGQMRDFYMFDLGGLGDSLVFDRNHVTSPKGIKKVLYITYCGGGSVTDNILNADVFIKDSKALVISANHMEEGSVIEINDSVVSLRSNYFEKGERESIVLRGNEASHSIVDFNHDMFMFYSRPRTKEEEKEHNANVIIDNIPPANPNDWPLIRERLPKICEYDIDIDHNSIVSFNNVYRYDLVNDFNNVFPFGIMVTSPAGPVSGFNDYSYFCSQKSSILPNYNVKASYSENKLNGLTCRFVHFSNYIPWVAAKGIYQYSYMFLWDNKRDIRSISNGSSHFVLTKLSLTGSGQHGPLLKMKWSDGSGFTKIRLFRDLISNGVRVKSEYVDLNICGSPMLYDNGFSIAGYKWIKCPDGIYNQLGKTTPEYKLYQYDCGQVTACAMTAPSDTSAWSCGDLIRNVGPSNTWEQITIK